MRLFTHEPVILYERAGDPSEMYRTDIQSIYVPIKGGIVMRSLKLKAFCAA